MTVFSDSMLCGGAYVPPTFISQSMNQVTTGTTCVVTAPTDIQAGDFLLAIVWGQSTLTSVTSSGFTELNLGNSGNVRDWVFSKTATGSEPGSYTFTIASSGADVRIFILNYRGVSGVDVVGNRSSGTSTVCTADTITRTREGLLIATICLNAGSRSITSPMAGATQRGFGSGTIAQSAVVYEILPSPAGVSPTRNCVWNTSTEYAGIQIQIY